MSQLNLKPAHAAVKNYYAALTQMGQLHFDNEAQVSDAFAKLLANCGRKLHLTFVPQFSIQRAKARVIVDGALVDDFHLAHGFWEAKDEKDDLDREIKSKLDKGYPRDNIIFQAPERAVLYQSGARIADEDISNPEYLTQIVNQFFDYKAPHIEEWEQAVSEFSERIPELAAAVKKIIDEERRRNPTFVRSFDDFYALCRQAINPNLSEDAVERMLIQHLLTERIFERIFDNPDFTRRNVVAAEIEKVIVELTKRAFNRNEFLRPLDRFYKAIETSAENTTGFSEKQAFLNKVYERFFQGYSPKEADTHGIVYTPQPIVNFMVRSVEEILQREFERSLGDKGVHILDPFVGTGNFIVNIMDKIKATDLPYKYENELHCNEVMLLPYYIASMNIEHAYFERTGEYKAFPGICLVDTFELEEPKQAALGFMTAKNAERVMNQKEAPIFVIIGNPPYNMGQVNENDNNKNRRYEWVDKRVAETYAKDSMASNVNKLNDPFIKAIRWASDRIGSEGIVAFVTNNKYLDGIATDGMRKHLAADFDSIYILDLGGDVKKNPKISGTTHNVFGIQVGVSINLLIRNKSVIPRKAQIYYAAAGEDWRREQKYQYLDEKALCTGVTWAEVAPDRRFAWLGGGRCSDFEQHLPIATGKRTAEAGIFSVQSLGINSNRDEWVYNYSRDVLTTNVAATVETYNLERHRWLARSDQKAELDSFLSSDSKKIKWSSRLKEYLLSNVKARFNVENIREGLYRPFSRQYLYFERVLIHRRGNFPSIFPTLNTEAENVAICVNAIGNPKPFHCLTTSILPDLHLTGDTQCFPFYIYAVLHHPEYRERYAANLRRELPRMPFAPVSSVPPCGKDLDVFRELVKAGQRLSQIHVHYEQQPEYQLTRREKAGEKLNWQVTRMRLSKDKTTLIYNDFLTLSEIPKETYDYRLGNRSALEWVIDQYQVSTDKRSGITNDPNREDDPQYILRLIGRVITVSLETVKIVQSLPSLRLSD